MRKVVAGAEIRVANYGWLHCSATQCSQRNRSVFRNPVGPAAPYQCCCARACKYAAARRPWPSSWRARGLASVHSFFAAFRVARVFLELVYAGARRFGHLCLLKSGDQNAVPRCFCVRTIDKTQTERFCDAFVQRAHGCCAKNATKSELETQIACAAAAARRHRRASHQWPTPWTSRETRSC